MKKLFLFLVLILIVSIGFGQSFKRIRGKAVYNNAVQIQMPWGMLPAHAPIAGIDVKVIGLNAENEIIYQKLMRTDWFGNYDTGYDIPAYITSVRIGGIKCEPNASDLGIQTWFYWIKPTQADINYAQNLLNTTPYYQIPGVIRRSMNVVNEGGAGFNQYDINQVQVWLNADSFPEKVHRIVGGEQRVDLAFSSNIFGVDVIFTLMMDCNGDLNK